MAVLPILRANEVAVRKSLQNTWDLQQYKVSKLLIRTHIDFQRVRDSLKGPSRWMHSSHLQVVIMCFLPSLSHSELWKFYFSTLITELVENVFCCLAVLLTHSICLWLFEKAILIRSNLQFKWTLIFLAKAGAAYLCEGWIQ